MPNQVVINISGLTTYTNEHTSIQCTCSIVSTSIEIVWTTVVFVTVGKLCGYTCLSKLDSLQRVKS